MPFEQLRALVVSLTAPADDPANDPLDDPAEAVKEFETQPTTCLPGPRTSTIDQLIAALRRPDVMARPPGLPPDPPRRRAPRR